MANPLGDFDPGAVIYFKFTSTNPSTGAPFTLAGTPSLSAWKDNSVTSSTSGLTLTADFGGITGSNHVTVDTSTSASFYAAGSFFDIMIAAGTVNSVSAVGSFVGEFTLQKISSLRPTTATRTLDVTATGAAGIDWGNVENKTTVNDLSSTNISTSQAIASVSGAVGSVTGAVGSVTGNVGGNVNGNVVGSVASVTLLSPGAIVTSSFFAGSIVTGSFFAGSFVTGTFFPGSIDSTVLNASAANEIADATLSRNVAGGSSTGRNVSEALYFLRNKWTVTSSILTVFATDDTTPSWTSSVGSDAAAVPIISSDPA